MKLVHAERLGEAFDSQLVIGVRESYGEKAAAQPLEVCRAPGVTGDELTVGTFTQTVFVWPGSGL